MKIPIYKPALPPYEVVEPDIRAMYESGMLYPGIYTERLVAQVKGYCGVDYALPVSSCSVALILMLSLIPKGSKVIIPSFTFNATLQALEWNDLIPVVVDVDEDGQMRPDLVRNCLNIEYDVRAVLPVHMWGNLCDTAAYQDISTQHNVVVFYDGAHVFGSFDAEKVEPGTATAFSIAATKPISAGEGGLIVTNEKLVFEHIRHAANHGLVDSLDTKVRGINGKIQEFNSILAFHAINNFEKTKRRRKALFGRYTAGVKDLPIRVWKAREGVEPAHKDCVVFLEDTVTRNALDTYLQSRGVGTKRYFEPAVPDMGSFDGQVHSASVGKDLAGRCLTLPLYPALTDQEVEYIVETIREFYKER